MKQPYPGLPTALPALPPPGTLAVQLFNFIVGAACLSTAWRYGFDQPWNWVLLPVGLAFLPFAWLLGRRQPGLHAVAIGVDLCAVAGAVVVTWRQLRVLEGLYWRTRPLGVIAYVLLVLVPLMLYLPALRQSLAVIRRAPRRDEEIETEPGWDEGAPR